MEGDDRCARKRLIQQMLSSASAGRRVRGVRRFPLPRKLEASLGAETPPAARTLTRNQESGTARRLPEKMVLKGDRDAA
jgi:hypothetical protein